MADSLKPPVTREQSYLAAIVDRLDRQNKLLTDVRDRLPAPGEPEPSGTGAVELTEPAVPGSGAAADEPSPPEESAPAEPAAKKAPAKKAGASKRSGKTSAAKTTSDTPQRSPRAKPAEGKP